jgi:hypothetical protein
MALMDAPRGPCPDESSPPLIRGYAEVLLDRLIDLLVIPLPPNLKCEGSFFPYGRAFEELYTEVQFCLWSMHMALSVHMELISSVDISVRLKISDTVAQFLADWRGGRGHALSDALDELIIRQFRDNDIVEIPDMARLQRIKDCAPISSTVASYIKDLTMRLDKSEASAESTIEMLFPVSDKFIGRCFFPRLAAVSYKLLELVRLDLESTDSVDSLCSTLTSSL